MSRAILTQAAGGDTFELPTRSARIRRNLTDDQLAAIRDSDGMVGLNFAVAFLRDDGRMVPRFRWNRCCGIWITLIDHLGRRSGRDGVGL